MKRDELEEMIEKLKEKKRSNGDIETTMIKREDSGSRGSSRPPQQDSAALDKSNDIVSHLEDIIAAHDNEEGCYDCFGTEEIQVLEVRFKF
jgi:hypothetical protein